MLLIKIWELRALMIIYCKDINVTYLYLYSSFKWNKPFLNESAILEYVDIHGQEESDVNKGIYASDHFALLANLNIKM